MLRVVVDRAVASLTETQSRAAREGWTEETLASALSAARVIAATADRAYAALVKGELGLEPERGKRYSPGYSACPDLADQGRIFRLLDPATTIGVTLTSAYQLVPEASTSAIVVHHPAAVYYLVKA